jgi:hypothetical protein
LSITQITKKSERRLKNKREEGERKEERVRDTGKKEAHHPIPRAHHRQHQRER